MRLLVLAGAALLAGCGGAATAPDGAAPSMPDGTPALGRVVVDLAAPAGPMERDAAAGGACLISRQDCPLGQGCYRQGCLPAGTHTVTTGCNRDQDCVPGLVCGAFPDTNRCVQYCEVGDPDSTNRCRQCVDLPGSNNGDGYCQ